MRHRLGLALQSVGICACVLLLSPLDATRANAATPPGAEGAHLYRPWQWYTHAQNHVPGAVDLGAQSASGTASAANLAYHGGSVMLTSTLYAIYWGPGQHTIPSTYETLIDRWFTDVGGSSMYNILTQYYEGSAPTYIENVSTLGGAWVDTVNPYPHAGTGTDPLLDADIQAEVERAIVANGWPNGGLNVAFFVFTAKGIESCADATDCTIGTAYPAYCAYHSAFFAPSSDVILYANMPYDGTWSSGYAYTCGNVNPSPNNDPDADIEISTTSHEQFEAVSDPVGDAWFDAVGYEIGDKCAYQYGTVAANGSNVVLNGDPYIVQEEWSNAIGGCTLAYAGSAATPTPASTSTPTSTAVPATPTATNTSAPPTATNIPNPAVTPTSTSTPAAANTPTLTPTPKKRGKHH
jgi:hypothetical protein